MGSFSENSGLSWRDISLRWLGGVSPQIVEAIYPMEAITKWHATHHIDGLTGTWMDTGSTAIRGAVRGSLHRLSHGHHLLEDGFKVLVNKDLKFLDFLHHLGLDSLTVRGIPNPLFPTAVARTLIDIGMSRHFVNDLMTVSVPKILSGSLGLVCAGNDVLLCFSDAIPHTFLASASHFGFGALNILFGLYPPNIFLLSAGTAEIGVGAITAYRAIVDPVIPVLHAPLSVFLPAIGQAIAFSAILGACVSIFTGKTFADASETLLQCAAAGAVSTTVKFMAAGAGFLSPFLGPMAGIASLLLLKKAFDALHAKKQLPGTYTKYRTFDLPDHFCEEPTFCTEYGTLDPLNIFREQCVIPLFGIPRQPIGLLKDDTFILNPNSLSKWGES